MKLPRYWVAVVSLDHALRGVNGGFIQVCHGKAAPLKRMRKDDYLLIYSPKLSMNGTEKCQSFTAVGSVKDELIYPFRMTETFVPFRRNINFNDSKACSILPLIPQLEFITDKKHWGYPFRFGFFEITENDFTLIASKMR